MIRVSVDLDSYGLGTSIKRLATVEIANDGGRREANLGNYDVRVRGQSGSILPGRHARVERHARKSLPVLTLVRKALQEAGY